MSWTFYTADGALKKSIDTTSAAEYLAVSAYMTSAQTISTGPVPEARIDFTNEDYDYGDFHSTTTNTSRLVAPRTGVYKISANLVFVANSTGVRYFAIRKNAAGSGSGGTAVFAETGNATTAPTRSHVSGSRDIYLEAGDYIEMFVYQNSGGNLNTSGGTDGTTLSMSLVTNVNHTSEPSFRGCRVYNDSASALSLTAATWGTIPFDHEVVDTHDLHDNSTNNTRITLGKVGYWKVGLTATFTSSSSYNSGNDTYVRILKNGTAAQCQGPANVGHASVTMQPVGITEGIVYAGSATDYIEGEAYSEQATNIVSGSGNEVAISMYAYFVGSEPSADTNLDTALEGAATVVWQDRATVNSTSTTAKVFYDGTVADYSSAHGTKGMVRIDPAHYAAGDRVCQIRAHMDYGSDTATAAKAGVALYPVSSISNGALTLGTLIDSDETVANVAADELGAANTGWQTITTAGHYVALFTWDTTASATDLDAHMRIEVRQQ